MGALARATRVEVEELAAGDAAWWPGLCGRVAEEGMGALTAERNMRGWSWGALWQWIVSDEKRYMDYTQALEARMQLLAHETVGIADGGEDRKLMVDTRFKLAGKVDRVRWGDKVSVDGGGSALLDAGLVLTMGALLGRVAGMRQAQQLPEAPQEKVISDSGDDVI